MKVLRRFVLFLFCFVVILALNEGHTQAQVQSGPIWNTQFFNNPYLYGQAVVTRQDSRIAFNWGTASPAAGVDADNFTARFSTRVYFDNKTYRFTIVADDSVHLIIDDNTMIIDTFDDPRPSQTLTADFKMSAGYHNVQVDFREVEGNALVYLEWMPVGLNTPPIVSSAPVSPSPNRWMVEYFANANLSGLPSAILNVFGPSNNWGSGSPLSNIPSDNFSARWTGNITLNGTYDLSIRADDGVRVSVDGITYINEWHSATGLTYTARFTVPHGLHRVVIEYYEASGDAYLEYGLILNSVGLFSAGSQAPMQTGSIGWTAQYYDNLSLSGSPVAIQTEYSINRNWGSGSPIPSLPSDGFSVRWSSIQALSAGTYRLNVRADDGVRVYIDGLSYINEWHPSNASQNYVVTFILPAGNHSFTVEYYETNGLALIDYNFSRIDTAVANSAPLAVNPTDASIKVSARYLNVRQTPSVVGGIITKIARNQVYPVVGRNADSSWWQIDVNNTIGWVKATYTSAYNTFNVPVTSISGQVNPPASAYSVTTVANLNLRAGVGTNSTILTVIPRNTTVSILARNANTSWWQVNYRGVVGWVSVRYTSLKSAIDLDQIPITQ